MSLPRYVLSLLRKPMLVRANTTLLNNTHVLLPRPLLPHIQQGQKWRLGAGWRVVDVCRATCVADGNAIVRVSMIMAATGRFWPPFRFARQRYAPSFREKNVVSQTANIPQQAGPRVEECFMQVDVGLEMLLVFRAYFSIKRVQCAYIHVVHSDNIQIIF